MKMRHLTVGHSAALASHTVDSAMAGHRRAYKPGTAVDYQESNSTNVGHGMDSGGAGGLASAKHDVTLGAADTGHHRKQPAVSLDIAA